MRKVIVGLLLVVTLAAAVPVAEAVIHKEEAAHAALDFDCIAGFTAFGTGVAQSLTFPNILRPGVTWRLITGAQTYGGVAYSVYACHNKLKLAYPRKFGLTCGNYYLKDVYEYLGAWGWSGYRLYSRPCYPYGP